MPQRLLAVHIIMILHSIVLLLGSLHAMAPGSSSSSNSLTANSSTVSEITNESTTSLQNHTVTQDKALARNYSDKSAGNETAEVNGDFCRHWESCSSFALSNLLFLFDKLPSCPCDFPTGLPYNNRFIYDPSHNTTFQWRLVNNNFEMLHIFKPAASRCIRQMTYGSVVHAGQLCCYDQESNLITRGSGAGTPSLISPDVSREMHYELDLSPWLHCGGDWTRYNKYRPPNNGLDCKRNPGRREFRRQMRKAKNY